MSILKNGYFKITKAKNDEFQVVLKGANHETLNHSETLKEWDSVEENILASVRATNGKFAIVVEATLQNLAKKKIYYKLTETGTLKQIAVTDEDEIAIQNAEESAENKLQEKEVSNG